MLSLVLKWGDGGEGREGEGREWERVGGRGERGEKVTKTWPSFLGIDIMSWHLKPIQYFLKNLQVGQFNLRGGGGGGGQRLVTTRAITAFQGGWTSFKGAPKRSPTTHSIYMKICRLL